jgi:hypothetical protein
MIPPNVLEWFPDGRRGSTATNAPPEVDPVGW